MAEHAGHAGHAGHADHTEHTEHTEHTDPSPAVPAQGAPATATAAGSTRTSAPTHFVPENLPSRIQHFIGGRFVDSVSGKTFDVLDPVSNQAYATAAAGQAEDIDRAVTAATEAFSSGPWPGMKPRERARILNRIADAVEAQDARLAELETFDTGLPITQALGQAQRAAENFRFFADLIVAQSDDAIQGARRPDQLRQPQADRRRRPDHPVEHPVHAGELEAGARRWPPGAPWC